MLRMLLVVLLALAVSTAGAQIVNRPVAANAIAAPSTTAPTACAVGNLFFKTNATAGQNLQLCTAANTWTGIGDGSGAGAFSTLSVTGQTLFGTTSAQVMGGATTPLVQQHGTTAATARSGGGRWSADASAFSIFGTKSRGASIGTHTIVQNFDALLSIAGLGSDGTNFQQAASINFAIDNTGTISATSMPGKITFSTSANSSVAPTAALTLDSSQIATFTSDAISPKFRSTTAKVLVQGTGTGATQLAATQTTVPTCSSNCGTSPSVAGTDTAGIVTMGASGVPASAWVVTFNGTWAAAPSCMVQSALASMVVGKMPIAVVTSTTTMTVTTNGTAPATSDKYQYHCIGVS